MKNVIIFCGGMSAEHEISIISARNVIAAIDKSKYHPILVIVSRSGTWYLQADFSIIDRIAKCSDPFEHGEICSLIRLGTHSNLITINGNQTKVDAAFPLIHGFMGEDGTLQGMLEVMNLPYVGSNVLSSAIGMDKDCLKKLWASEDIPIVPYICVRDKSKIVSYEEATGKLNSKILFVKPAIMGSSVGVYKVKTEADYEEAIKNSFKYSHKVLIEKFIPCREIESAVLGNENPISSILGEIVPNHEFYSYEAKYIDPNGANLVIPADISKELSQKIQTLAVKAYKITECSGMARVDFFLDKIDGEIYINELNTIPGFTSISMYPKLWGISGIDYSSLITKLIEFAFEKYKAKQEICLSPY